MSLELNQAGDTEWCGTFPMARCGDDAHESLGIEFAELEAQSVDRT